MKQWNQELEAARSRWLESGRPRPDVALVAGSGLSIELDAPIERLAGPEPLAEWLPFPVQPVAGHEHAIELLRVGEARHVLYFRGRLHSYQGYDAGQVAFPVRLAAQLGASVLVMTNAAGGVRSDWEAGTLVAVSDHLNLTGLNPLRGEPPSEWGPRFPDMLGAYDLGLRTLAREQARRLGFELESGVYAGLAGPSYETAAEIRMLRALGADLVGMSTVLEVIAARHLGMRSLVISLVSNPAAGVTQHALDHADVLRVGRQAASRVAALLRALLTDSRLTGPPAAG